ALLGPVSASGISTAQAAVMVDESSTAAPCRPRSNAVDDSRPRRPGGRLQEARQGASNRGATEWSETMQLSRFPRRRYTSGATELRPLDRLSAHLGGPRLWIKRDDQLGLAAGGNKTRKLEFLVADALKAG